MSGIRSIVRLIVKRERELESLYAQLEDAQTAAAPARKPVKVRGPKDVASAIVQLFADGTYDDEGLPASSVAKALHCALPRTTAALDKLAKQNRMQQQRVSVADKTGKYRSVKRWFPGKPSNRS